MKKIIAFLFSVFVSSSSFVFAQCCSTGCSMSGTKNFGVNEKNHLQVISFYKHGYSDHYFEEDKLSDFKALTNSYFDYSGLDISYGINSKLTVAAQMGYYMNKTQNYIFGGYQLAGHGIADGTLLLKYNFFTSKDSAWSFTFMGGEKFPTGTFNEYVNYVLLSPDVQSGTGAYAEIAGLTVKLKPFHEKKFSLVLNTKATWEGTNPNGYKYGFATLNSIATSITLFKKCFFLMMFQNENRTRDLLYGTVRSETGFTKVAAVPGIVKGLGREWELGAYADFPLT